MSVPSRSHIDRSKHHYPYHIERSQPLYWEGEKARKKGNATKAKTKSNLCPHRHIPGPEVILVFQIVGWRRGH